MARQNRSEGNYGGKIMETFKDICDSFGGNMMEAAVDASAHTIRNVAIASTRESANGYSYSDRSFQTLCSKVSGTKCFASHSDERDKNRGNVRDIRDWIGTFGPAIRKGDKITAPLTVREAYWPFMKDIAEMDAGIGMSLNSRVKVTKDEHGKESVVDIDSLRSIDCFSAPALTKGLFEAAGALQADDL
jgi:hypothetical protein